LLAEDARLDLQVFFLSDFSVHNHYEAAFRKDVKWDVPLLEGYRSELLPRVLIGKSTELRARWPVAGMAGYLAAADLDALWIHGWGHIGLWQAARAARKLKLPLLLRGETTPYCSRAHGCKKLLRARFCRGLFKQVSGFLCVGKLNREYYRSFGVNEERLFSMPYAVDNEWFQSRCAECRPHKERFREKLGLTAKRPVILFCGKLIPEKGSDDLLEAFLKAFPNITDTAPYLLFVGDGPMRKELEKRAAHRTADIRFMGFKNQTELPAFYDLCDLFVLPSRFEPWGLVVNEVMNAAKPVIISDRVGCGADLVENNVNGFVFKTGSVNDLAVLLSKTSGNCELLSSMGCAAFSRITNFGFEEDRSGLFEALQTVAGVRSHPNPKVA